MIDQSPAPTTPEGVVWYFRSQKDAEAAKILGEIDKNKFSPRQRRMMASRIQWKIGSKVCFRATPSRMFHAKATLRRVARGLREVDPRRIIFAVALNCQLEALTVATLWPEIARELENETIR